MKKREADPHDNQTNRENISMNSPSWEIFCRDNPSPDSTPDKGDCKLARALEYDSKKDSSAVSQADTGDSRLREETFASLSLRQSELEEAFAPAPFPQIQAETDRSLDHIPGMLAPDEQQEKPAKKYKKKRLRFLSGTRADQLNEHFILICVIAGTVIVCLSGVLMYSYFAAQKKALSETLNQQIAVMSQENAAAFSDLSGRIENMESQMNEVVSILENTDEAILASGAENREAMSKRIEEMDKQLAQLKASLNALLEDKNR